MRKTAVPLWVQGGIGLHTAGAAIAGGARGIVVDTQLALARDCALPGPVRAAIAAMDGSETVVVDGHRVSPQLDLPTLPIGQDAAFAAPLAARYRTAGSIVHALRRSIAEHLSGARESLPLGPGAGVAAVHGLRYPIAQGPMTRVSDRAAFASVVAEAGGLPFLALSLMRGEEITGLLDATRRQVGGRPWGVGVMCAVPPELREEQLAAVLAARPPLALVAGGGPAQAGPLEAGGIATFLDVPSPRLLDQFVRDGARRFVFQGHECGGHVGPRSSFTLWEQQIEQLLAADPAVLADVEVLFAGGIHDARSAAMVATLAAPLVERGVSIGVLMGTAYMATAEAVATGAITPTSQQVVLECRDTVLLETSPGLAARCAATPRPAGDVMVGQVAALHERPTSVARVHADVSEGSSRLLANVRDDAVRTAVVIVDEERSRRLGIAVVGTAGTFPGAESVEQFWANVVAGVDVSTTTPIGPDQFLSLEVAAAALADAGYADREFDRDHVAVVFGAPSGIDAASIASWLDLGGAASTVDAAGGAALAAATKELTSGAASMVLCGGADLGEGVGCVVLKRRADAERDGDRILAVLDAVAAASDGAARRILTDIHTERGAVPGSTALGSAAGIAALITAVHSVHRGVLPPTLVGEPDRATPWIEPRRRAAVTAVGSGGSNVHVVLSSDDGGDPPEHGLDHWPAELFVLGGAAPEESAAELDHLLSLLDTTGAPLRDLATTMAARAAGRPVACTIVADTHDDLRMKLDALHTAASPLPRGCFVAASARGDAGGDDLSLLSNGSSQVALLFPGDGGWLADMAAELFVAFPALRHHLDPETRWAPPAAEVAERAIADLLGRCGVDQRHRFHLACDVAAEPGLRRFLLALAELAVQPQVTVDTSPLFAGRTAVVDAPASVRSAALVPRRSRTVGLRRTGLSAQLLDDQLIRERDMALATLGAPMVGGAVQAANAAPPTVTQFGAAVEVDSAAVPDVVIPPLSSRPLLTPPLVSQPISPSSLSQPISPPFPPPSSPPSASRPAPASTLVRSVPQLVALPEADAGVSLAGVTVGVVGGGSNLAGPLSNFLRAMGATPLELAAHETAFAGLGLLVDLTALRLGGDDPTAAATGQFRRLRAAVGAGVPDIVVVTGLGGELGLTGPGDADATTYVGAAALGMVRTAAREALAGRIRVVDLPVAGDPHLRARQVADELATSAPPREVGYAARRRRTLEIVPRAREVDASTGLHRNDFHLGRHSVVLVTGGTRGIGARCTLELARRYGCAFEIVGRVPLSAEARAHEVGQTLDELRTHARSVRYHAADIRDTAVFGPLIDEMRMHHGRLDGVLHAAGIREDEAFADKTVDSFARVFDTRVCAADLLADAVDFGGFVVFVGGVSGVFGHPGRIDGAAAGSVLDVVAHRRSGASRERRLISVDWGPIDPDAGVAALVDELRHGAPDPQVVLMPEPPR